MMKRKLATLLTLTMLLTPAALAATQEEAQNTAQALVGTEATLTKLELDDGYYEFDFQDANSRYEVTVNAGTGAACKLETKRLNVQKAASAVLDEAAARAAAQETAPEATLHYAVLEKDDGRYEWNVFYSEGGVYGICSVQAETGELYATEVFYGMPEGAMTADQAVEALVAAKGELIIRELDLELDDDTGAYTYEGKAELNGTVYEFELDAVSGSIFEWERD